MLVDGTVMTRTTITRTAQNLLGSLALSPRGIMTALNALLVGEI